jgi:hypothetical protein
MSKRVITLLAAAALLYVYPLSYLAILLIVSLRKPEVTAYCFNCFLPPPLLMLTVWDYLCAATLVTGLALTFAAIRLHKEEKAENARY